MARNSIDPTPDDFEIIKVPDPDTSTASEIVNSIDTDKNAASLPSLQASRQDELFSKTQPDFEHGVPPDLSSPFSDFDTTHSRRDPVPPHFTELRADMVDLCLRPRFGASAAGETVASHHNDNSFSDPEDGELDPIINPLIEAANNPPPFRGPEPWKDVPASYVPRHWPTGPRKLAPGRYICPFEGCKHPVGPTESGEGYSRTTLGPHIRTHDNYSWGGRFGLRSTMRTRVMALRNPQRRDLYGPAGVVIDLSRNDSDPLPMSGDPVQEETDALIPYLEEIKNFEQSNVLRDPTIIDRKLRLYFRGDEKLERPETEEEVGGESVPQQSSSRSCSDGSWNALQELIEKRQELKKRLKEVEKRWKELQKYQKELQEARSPSSLVNPEAPSSPEGMATDTDRSGEPPRKRARTS